MVKRIKARQVPDGPIDWSALLRGTPTAALERLRQRVGDDDRVRDLLLEVMDQRRGDPRTPGTAAAMLVLLGAGDDLLERCLARADAWVADEDIDSAFGTGAVFKVLGASAGAAWRRRILDHLSATTPPPLAWPLWVDVLADCGERGLRDDEAWDWIGRVREEHPALWCAHVGVYGDRRAESGLRALLASHTDKALTATGPRGSADDVVLEAISALVALGVATDDDLALQAQHRARLQQRTDG